MSAGTKRFLEGDWYCTACQSHNFARRGTCFRCHAMRPENIEQANELVHQQQQQQSAMDGEGVQQATAVNHYQYEYPRNNRMKRGDWFCAQDGCRQVNFASRTRCHLCDAPKPQLDTEWPCPACAFNNLAFRVACNKCQAPRPQDFAAPPARDGEWVCDDGECRFMNFARRQQCFECGRPRPHAQ